MSEYRYSKVELSPEIMMELIVLLYKGRQFSRDECISTVVEYHMQHGGVCNHKSYVSAFKHATQKLRAKGYALTNVAYGVWRLNDDVQAYDSYWNRSTNNNVSGDTQVEIGRGCETVYVYYYPIYRRFALLNNKSVWFCKIGMTTKNLWDRIYSQAATCFPEEPVVALIIKCDDAHTLEYNIHKVLKKKNQWVENAPGKEWFLTSPDEIKEIYRSIIDKE